MNAADLLEEINMQTVEKWDVFEVTLPGHSAGNPFTDYTIRGTFTGSQEQKTVDGFYDGDGRWIVRFMPSFEGEYTWRVEGTFADAPSEGRFLVTAPSEGNHGPVRVANTYHFAYEDGTPYYSIGTTCYVWELQSDEQIAQTLESLREARFNKIRFCILPKHYDYNLREPRSYPYEGTPMDSSVLTTENFGEYNGRAEGNQFDYTRFNPAHFRHIEQCILALRGLGIEADLIVMHPYDRWGFSLMTPEQDDLYWRYVLARFSCYRNVWWSLANEYDILTKTLQDWERYASIICEKDAYAHLRSIHNCTHYYDYSRPWITHCSVQRTDLYKSAELTDEFRQRYHKPVVLDEIAYEGNIQHGWGNLTGEEMLRRFWETACRGGYPGHGETMLAEDQMLWWSHGGKLRGESWKRFGFLLDILKETPGLGLQPIPAHWDEVTAIPHQPGVAEETGYRLCYYSFMRPSFREFHLDDDSRWEVEVIDTWNMTIEKRGVFTGRFRVDLPGRPYMAIRLRKAR